MRALIGLVAVALVLPNAVVADPGAPTGYGRVVEELVATFGFVPETALVGGVEVPTEVALALLRANDAALPAAENVYAPYQDVGFGVKQGGGPCLVAAVFTAYAISFGAPQPAFVETRPALGPGGTVACGAGFAYGTGIGGAELAPTATFSFVCLNTGVAGTWANNPDPCYAGGITAVNMVGRVGFVDITFSFFGIHYRIQQMFCGVQGAAPGPAGNVDACAVGVA